MNVLPDVTAAAPATAGRSASLEILRQDRDRFVAFAFAASEALLETDADGVILFAAGALRATFSTPAEQLVGRSLYDLLPLGERPKLRVLLGDLLRAGRTDPVRLLVGERALIISAAMIPDRRERAYLSLRTETAAARPNSEASVPLVGQADFTALAAEAVRSRTAAGAPFRVSMLAAKGLQEIGARLDAEAAAELQAEITASIRRHSAGADAAARFDGGRFSFIHQAGFDLAGLSREMETIGRSKDPSGIGIRVETATMDLAAEPGHEAESAQAMLYAINSFAEGRRDFTLADLGKGAQHLMHATVRRMKAFRLRVSNRRFDIAFQPIVDLRDGQVHHHEALVRFEPRESPFDAIRFAEKVGLIAEFDLAMAEKVLARMARGHIGGAKFSAAINISGRSLESADFLDRLDRLLQAYHAVRGYVLFEVTESSEIRDLEQAAGAIDRLRAAGYPVCLDDFGAGANAFHYLRALAVDYVKIDGAYIKDVLATPRLQPFLAAMVQLCRALGIATVAEMVESEETRAHLLAIGVGYGQGYLFGRPSVALPQA